MTQLDPCTGISSLVRVVTLCKYGLAPQTLPNSTLEELLHQLAAQPEPFRLSAYALLSTAPKITMTPNAAVNMRALLGAALRISDPKRVAVQRYLAAYEGARAAKFSPAALQALMDPLLALKAAGVPRRAVLLPWSALKPQSVTADGIVRSGPIIAPVDAPFEDVAQQVLPENWSRCIPAIVTRVSDPTTTGSGWQASVEETVNLGPQGILTVTCDLDVNVREVRGAPADDINDVLYRLRTPNPTLTMNEGRMAVCRYPQLENSYSLVTVEKDLQFVNVQQAKDFGDLGLRTLLQVWMSAAYDECEVP